MATTRDKSRRHWRALREAILSSARQPSQEALESATHSSTALAFFPLFPVHRVIDAKLLPPPSESFEWVTYDTNIDKHDEMLALFVHEKQQSAQRKVSLLELCSHGLNQGVDNTGNIRTWPSEQVLLSYLLKHKVLQHTTKNDRSTTGSGINCCELGSGMAGLVSLGLIAHAPVPIARFLITDGNPLAVQNVRRCVEANKAHGTLARSRSAQVDVDLLRWDRNVRFDASLAHQFDVIVASDCLFFEDFHVDLVHTIHQLLCVNSGKCFMLQPSRNDSMERFCALARARGLSVQEERAYDPEITRKHHEYVQTRADYVPDVHFPVLLVLSLASDCL